jgi:hypothetical protein
MRRGKTTIRRNKATVSERRVFTFISALSFTEVSDVLNSLGISKDGSAESAEAFALTPAVSNQRFLRQVIISLLLFTVVISGLAQHSSLALAADAGDDDDRALVCSAPERLTLGILPQRLDLTVKPAAIKTGLDCGMLEMCGIDPCLCGYPDSYGACACNGLEETRVALKVQSDNPATLGVLQMGNSYWLVPLSAGGATVSVTAVLPHYEDARVVVFASVNAPVPPLLIYILTLLAIAGLVIATVRVLVRRTAKAKTGDGTVEEKGEGPTCGSSSGKVAVKVAVSLLAVLGLLVANASLVSCRASVEVTENSPRLISSSVASMGDGTEGSQRVVARLVFDRPLALDGDALSGLEVKLNDEAIDDDAIAVSIELEDDDTLAVTLSPASGAGSVASPHYFAVYEGFLSLDSREASGGLAHVRAADEDGRINAVMNAPVELLIPSGLIIEVTESVAGDSATGTPASATFRVAQTPKIRAVSWLEIEPGGQRALIHNHEFATFTDDAAGRERYAAFIVDPLRRAFGSDYVITQSADTVSVAAQTISDGRIVSPVVVEGVM